MYSNDSSFAEGFIAGQNGANNRNDGMWGDGMGMWAWILLLAVFSFGGWGGGFGGGWGNGANGAAQFTDAAVQRGFDTQNIIGKLDGINSGLCDGFYAVNTSLLNGFNGVARDMCTGFANVTAGINENRFAAQQCCCAIERAVDNSRFDTQTGFNALGSQLASCCCDIRSGLKDIQFQNATDTCALQTTMLNNTRDIIDSQNAGTRAILDWLCAKETADLRAENQTLKLAASQQAQNSYLVEQLRPAAKPAYLTCSPFASAYGFGYGFPGYGYNNSCGCGCNSGCCGCNG